jgi:hypothetical protein
MKNKIQDLRNHLFEQIERLSDDELNLENEVKKAQAMAQIAHQIIETARVEVNYIRTIGTSQKSEFIKLEGAEL